MKWSVPILVLGISCSADDESAHKFDVPFVSADAEFSGAETDSPVSCPDPTCDDFDPCTTDRCVGTTCDHQPVVLACDDGNPCTTDECFDGACQFVPATGLPCDDSNACTENSACTSTGVCGGGGSIVCDTDDPCSFASCSPDKGCSVTPAPENTPCNDTNACTTADKCIFGVCTGLTIACQTKTACQVHTGCTAAGECIFESAADGTACDDGNKCTLNDQCQDGTCFPGPAAVCDDGNPCTDDQCKPKTGCESNLPIKVTPCNDGSFCTTKDTCKQGQCTGEPVDCDDQDPCTDDSCNPTQGCTHMWNTNPCPAGSPCVLGAACKDGKCVSGTLKNCDDANPCTADSCDPKNGDCVHTFADWACDDNNPCTDNDQCQPNGACAGTPKVCTTTDDCTTAKCNLFTGKCVPSPAPNDTPCVTEVCEFVGLCQSGICEAKPAPNASCNDNNPCTDDLCNPKVGCEHTNNTDVCTDNNLCTINDTCTNGGCKGLPKNCDDNWECTDDSCNPQQGCQHTFNNAPCNDGDSCTTQDQCDGGGACVGLLKITVCGPCAGENEGCPPGFTCTSGACLSDDEVYVPGGPFYMGCTPGPTQICTPAEGPAHMVDVPPFVIDRYEVSIAKFTTKTPLWEIYVDPLLPCTVFETPNSAHPVHCVSRAGAEVYCQASGKRLCSETEWEKAARGGCEFYDNCQTQTPPYPWGFAAPTCQLTVYTPNESDFGCGTDNTFPVGSKPLGQSPYGCHDMVGNAWEWVADCWHSNLMAAPTDGSVWNTSCTNFVDGTIRGGGFKNKGWAVTATTRDSATLANNKNIQIGFRCCRTPQP